MTLGVVELTVFGRFCLFDPVGQVADEIEEKIFFWHRNDLVGDLDKETEPFIRFECQPLRYALAKVLGPGGRIDLESLCKTLPNRNKRRNKVGRKMSNRHLICVVGEVNFMEDLRRLVLDGLYLDLVRRILSLAVSQRFLQPLERIGGDGMTAGPQE